MLGSLIRGLSNLIVTLSALNVGIMGLTNNRVNFVAKFLGGEGSFMTQIAYIVVGIAGLMKIASFCFCGCKRSKKGECCHSGHHSDKKE